MQDCQAVLSGSLQESSHSLIVGLALEKQVSANPTNPTEADPNMLQNRDCWMEFGNYLVFWWIEAVAVSILIGDAVS